jgi:hypothetical protein
VAGERLCLRALGEGSYELVLRCAGAGEQRFAEASWVALERAIGGLAPFATHRRADMPGAVFVDADALVLVRHSDTLDVEVIPEQVCSPGALRAEKAARQAALEASWAEFATPERLVTLMRDRKVRPHREKSMA